MQRSSEVVDKKAKITVKSINRGTGVFEEDASMTVADFKKKYGACHEVPPDLIRFLCNGKPMRNYQKISEFLSEDVNEMMCYMVLRMGRTPMPEPYSLRLPTVLRCLAGKPSGTCIFWRDFDNPDIYTVSHMIDGQVVHYDFTADDFMEDCAGRKQVISAFDDLLADEEVKRHIQVKSLFSLARTVFSSTAPEAQVREVLDRLEGPSAQNQCTSPNNS